MLKPRCCSAAHCAGIYPDGTTPKEWKSVLVIAVGRNNGCLLGTYRPQPHNNIDLHHFVTLRGLETVAETGSACRDIRHATAVLEIKMAMIGRIRIKNRLAALDREAPDKADFGKEVEHVLNRRQRGEHPRLMRLGRDNVGGDVTIALAIQ